MNTSLKTLLEKAEAPTLHAVPYGRNLISVASGKGGVGKTWFSITLAHVLARKGQNILLFDGDLGLANIDIQIGLMPDHDLADVIRGTKTLDQIVTRFDDDTKIPAGFDILAGKSGSGALGSLRHAALDDMKSRIVRLASRYDLAILDLGAGLDAGVSAFSGHDGRILVVATPDPASLTDAYAYIKRQRMLAGNTSISIVVNMAQSQAEGKRTYETLRRVCENFLKFSPQLAGIVRSDRNVSDAIRHQTSTLTRHPLTRAVADVEIIALHLVEKVSSRIPAKT